MDKNLLLVIVGALGGFFSAVILELARQYFERKRIRKEQEYNAKQLREKNLREFLEVPDQDTMPDLAWLRLIHTRPVSLIRGEKTQKARKTHQQSQPSFREKLASFFFKRKPTSAIDIEFEAMPTLKKFILKKTQIIGRQDDCEIMLEDPSVSRNHALIRFDGQDYIIYDLGSTLNTLVNSKRVPSTGIALIHRDRLSIGESELIFEVIHSKSRKHKSSSKNVRKDVKTTILPARKITKKKDEQ